MKLIKTTVLDTTAASVTISNIPQEFKSLKLITSIRTDGSATATNALLTFNGSSSGYSERLLYGDGVTARSANAAGTSIIWTNLATANLGTAGTFGNSEITIPNYSSNTTNKVVLSSSVNESNSTTANHANQYLDAAIWSNNSSITSITLTGSSQNFVAGSTFYLYGIA